MTPRSAVLLDVDGTLVDSSYFHTLAWYRAMRREGRQVSMSDLHRLIGMGADQLLERVTGGPSEQLEKWWSEEFAPLRDEIGATPGARDLVRALHEHRATTVLATSGRPDDAAAFRAVIGAEPWIDAVVSSDEVQQSKPAPDIFELALHRAGCERDRVMVIGDTVWDIEAAKSCGLACIAVASGGISRPELIDAGAAAVYDTPRELLDHLPSSPLAAILNV